MQTVAISGFANQIIYFRHYMRVLQNRAIGATNICRKTEHSGFTPLSNFQSYARCAKNMPCIGEQHLNIGMNRKPTVVAKTGEECHGFLNIFTGIKRLNIGFFSLFYRFFIIIFSIFFLNTCAIQKHDGR